MNKELSQEQKAFNVLVQATAKALEKNNGLFSVVEVKSITDALTALGVFKEANSEEVNEGGE